MVPCTRRPSPAAIDCTGEATGNDCRVYITSSACQVLLKCRLLATHEVQSMTNHSIPKPSRFSCNKRRHGHVMTTRAVAADCIRTRTSAMRTILFRTAPFHFTAKLPLRNNFRLPPFFSCRSDLLTALAGQEIRGVMKTWLSVSAACMNTR